MISVVTLTYNNFQQLQDTLHSLRSVPDQDFEVIVVNGGQCAQTEEYLNNQFLEQFPRGQGRFVSGKDQGIADAFNIGLRLCQGLAVTYLNSGDQLLDVHYYGRCNQRLQENPHLGFIHSAVIFVDQLAGRVVMGEQKIALGRGMPYLHQTMVVRRSVFEQLGEFKLTYRMAMDFEFVCRLQKNHIQGFYDTSSPVVLMDGEGVSVQREWGSILECSRALQENQLWNLENQFAFFLRVIFYHLRRMIKFFHGDKWLIYFKNRKYKL